MSRGRTAKPTALKALQGNAGHRTDDRGNEPAPPSGAPEPPRHLSDRGRRKWFEICAQMLKVSGWLTQMDGDVLAAYCSAWALFEEAETDLPKLKRIYATAKKAADRKRAWSQICFYTGQRKQAMKDLKAFGTEFGWSAASRTRIRVNPAQGELPLGEAESPFARAQNLAHGA
jgi:P27 family predicted phage terminase small subunit